MLTDTLKLFRLFLIPQSTDGELEGKTMEKSWTGYWMSILSTGLGSSGGISFLMGRLSHDPSMWTGQ